MKQLERFRKLRFEGIKLDAQEPQEMEDALRRVLAEEDIKHLGETVLEVLSVRLSEAVKSGGWDMTLNGLTTYYQFPETIQEFIEAGFTRYRETILFGTGSIETLTPKVIYDTGGSHDPAIPYYNDIVKYHDRTLQDKTSGRFYENRFLVTLTIYRFTDDHGADFECTNANIYLPNAIRR